MALLKLLILAVAESLSVQAQDSSGYVSDSNGARKVVLQGCCNMYQPMEMKQDRLGGSDQLSRAKSHPVGTGRPLKLLVNDSFNGVLRGNEAYWLPCKNLEKNNEEATGGYTTLRRDTERIQRIRNGLTVLDRKLQLLQSSLPREDGLIRWFKARYLPKLTGSSNAQQGWRMWLSQQGSQFEDSWKKLLASVTGEEPGIKIQSEWNQGLL